MLISGDSSIAEQLSFQMAEGGSIPTSPLQVNLDSYKVAKITYAQCKPWFLYKHYARRMPSISYSFGLYDSGGCLQGACAFGTPPSATLRAGVCGAKNIKIILELNRLCLNGGLPSNAASYFISRCLKELPSPLVIVSYADTAQGHVGYIYQALNFLYTGLSAKRTDWKIKGMEALHGQTIADMSRGQKDRAKFMREKYGDNFYLQARPRKHRYIYIIGTKEQRKQLTKAISYPILPYPKGNTQRYSMGDVPNVKK